MRIVLPGGSGQAGQILQRHFEGHEVIVLSRNSGWRDDAIDGADVVINLAGRSVDCRYTPANRREIIDSRVQTTEWIGRAIAAARHPPRVWLNASTATIYRHEYSTGMDEESGTLGGDEPGAPDTWRFSIDVAKRWEGAFFASDTPATRKVALRSAMIMSPDPGGVFSVLSRLVRFGLGGRAGNGRQYMSWVHEADFCAAIDWLLTHEDTSGTVNITSPNPLPNSEFMAELRRQWGVPFGLPATEWMIEAGAFVLRTESELILKSRRVVPRRLLDAGFNFRFPLWPEAAADLVARS
ncbi:MAG: DUF1731 domain-containing protein [Acidobacteria bacterium]|nr:DUF1731 domain-containing protein [Acidobacteriota bacterium]